MTIKPVDHLNQTLPPAKSPAAALKGEGPDFASLLAGPKTASAPKAPVGSAEAILLENQALSGLLRPGLEGTSLQARQQLERTLDRMDRYAVALGDGARTLKEVAPLADDLGQEADRLTRLSSSAEITSRATLINGLSVPWRYQMLNAVNNYNVLGKLGPHYERPEYRPPAGGGEERPPSARTGDRSTLSGAKKNGTAANRPAPVPVTRLNLAGARNLVSALAAQISVLPPQSTDREPHTWLRSNLMTPVYV